MWRWRQIGAAHGRATDPRLAGNRPKLEESHGIHSPSGRRESPEGTNPAATSGLQDRERTHFYPICGSLVRQPWESNTGVSSSASDTWLRLWVPFLTLWDSEKSHVWFSLCPKDFVQCPHWNRGQANARTEWIQVKNNEAAGREQAILLWPVWSAQRTLHIWEK